MKYTLLFLLAAGCWVPATSVYAQSINRTIQTGSNPTIGRHIENSNVAMITLTAAPAFGANPSWSYCITRVNLGHDTGAAANCTPSTSPPAVPGLGVTISGNTFTLSKTAVTEGKYHIEIAAEDPVDGDFGRQEFNITIRKPLSLLFVLDRSSSMECSPSEDTENIGPGGWPDCISAGPAGSRWDMLKNAVGTFMSTNFVSDVRLDNDRAGVVYFSGNTVIEGALTPAGTPFIQLGAFQAGINGDMSSAPVQGSGTPPQLATNGTSLGSGLVTALQGRFGNAADADYYEWLIMLSDGEQNNGLWMRPNGRMVQQSQSNTTLVQDLDAVAIRPINLYTAGLSVATPAAMMMSDISDLSPSGVRMNTGVQAGMEANFVNDFSNHLFTSVMEMFSPEFIRSERQLTNQDTLSFSFTCNKALSTIYLSAHFDQAEADNYRYIILHNGIDVTSDATNSYTGEVVRSYAFDFDHTKGANSEGEWRIVATRPLVEVQYPAILKNLPPDAAGLTFYALADDPHISFDGHLQESRVSVGRSIHPIVQLWEGQEPIDSGAQVLAVILKPGGDLGDILARTPVPVTEKSSESGSCASQKYAYLRSRNADALAAVLDIQSDTVALQPQGNGRYAGTYSDVDVSGVYKVIYLIKTTSDSLGYVERMKEQTVVVRFAPIDLALTPVQLSKDNEGPAFIVLRPAYISGADTLLLGPGFEHAFSLESPGAQLVSVTDDCDGDYELVVSGNINATGTLYLYDEPIYKGPIKDIVKPHDQYKNVLSLHVGRTFPTGALDMLVDQETFFELDYAYQLSSFFSLELVGGYYGFSNDFNVLGATLFARGSIGQPQSGWWVSGAIGGGVYQPKNMDATLGYALRASVYRRINPHISAGIDGSFFRLNQPDYRFYTLGAGLKYHF